MHLGLMMECDYREGRTQREAFDEAFVMTETAEAYLLNNLGMTACARASCHGRGKRA